MQEIQVKRNGLDSSHNSNMGISPHKTENELSDEFAVLETDGYLVLGLNSKTPRVLTLLSAVLERSVQKNTSITNQTTKTKDALSLFHGLRAPTISIHQYIDRIFKYSGCSPSCFVIAQIYIDRFIQRSSMYLTTLNVHRLLLTSVLVAAKFMDDRFFSNAYYSKVGGLTTVELNRLEMKLLFGLDFRLHVEIQTFGKYCSMLKKEDTALQIEHPLMACGKKESWADKDDITCVHTVAR